jgi:LemA protein
MISFLIVAILIAIFASYAVKTYKELVELKELRKSTVMGLEKALTNRYNIMENLIVFSKGYIEDQNRFVVKLLQARLVPVEERVTIEKELVEELKSLLSMISEIPPLKADRDYTTLRLQLAKAEKIIFEEEEAFNERTIEYDRAVTSFPKKIIAILAGFKPAPTFEINYLTR